MKKVSDKKKVDPPMKAPVIPYAEMDHFNTLFISVLNEGEAGIHSPNTKELMDILNDNLRMVDEVKKGVPYSLFAALQKLLPLTIKDWEEILNLNMRSVMRYKAQGKSFKPIQSEKIIEIGNIYILGNEVFGDKDKFDLWLIIPSFALGGKRPIDLLKGSYGQELVVNELHRIDHGIFV